ncbi:alpha/beta hydrolase [Aeromicrobium choanae]|uniref:Pimeloyl-ACP methyl ester carboxylesterase n=1 Tax=Aeromicrobium choanae TaxID=1736691 RepID=A0A1T4Z742_9ACTN|nr:alpha/beta hydrolase [Aeromicrobium choanae]SKB09870.1 Pimeloyl-ACP methyl ester carboxylesterase [Aeromicrobium choanae]
MHLTMSRGQARAAAAFTALALLLAAVVVAFDTRTSPVHGAGRAADGQDATRVLAAANATRKSLRGKKATVVLVHGAFADASGWTDVQSRLLDRGYTVHAWANPLRGVSSDGEYLRSFLGTIAGPIILVGHSYGGAVITQASTGNENVVSLVYVAAYALANGETVAQANELGGGHSDVIDSITVRPYPGAPEGDGDATIQPSRFRNVFAQDLPHRVTRTMATAQRPATLSSLVIPAGEPGYKTIPSYFLVAKEDRVIPPQAQAAMAQRAGARTSTYKSSHALLITRAKSVTDQILLADQQH